MIIVARSVSRFVFGGSDYVGSDWTCEPQPDNTCRIPARLGVSDALDLCMS